MTELVQHDVRPRRHDVLRGRDLAPNEDDRATLEPRLAEVLVLDIILELLHPITVRVIDSFNTDPRPLALIGCRMHQHMPHSAQPFLIETQHHQRRVRGDDDAHFLGDLEPAAAFPRSCPHEDLNPLPPFRSELSRYSIGLFDVPSQRFFPRRRKRLRQPETTATCSQPVEHLTLRSRGRFSTCSHSEQVKYLPHEITSAKQLDRAS